MSNYSKGIFGTIAVLVVLTGFYIVHGSIKSGVKNSAEKYLIAQLDKWKEGSLSTGICNIVPDDFQGNLNDWKKCKLTGYFIEELKAGSKYVRRKTFGRKRGLWYYIEKLSPSNVYVYADVELDMEGPEGYPKTFKVRYRLEPRENGKFLITKGVKLF